MPTVEVPHFDLPFRFVNGRAAVVEQESIKEVTNCVEAILRYPLGFRDELPEFGAPDQVFTEGPIDTDELESIVHRWEPRAEALIEEQTDLLDAALRHVNVQVGDSEIG